MNKNYEIYGRLDKTFEVHQREGTKTHWLREGDEKLLLLSLYGLKLDYLTNVADQTTQNIFCLKPDIYEKLV